MLCTCRRRRVNADKGEKNDGDHGKQDDIETASDFKREDSPRSWWPIGRKRARSEQKPNSSTPVLSDAAQKLAMKNRGGEAGVTQARREKGQLLRYYHQLIL